MLPRVTSPKCPTYPASFSRRIRGHAQQHTPVCTGHNRSTSQVAEIFVRGLLAEGVCVRVLARDAEALAHRYREATVVAGGMMNPGDVTRAFERADAGFFMTPAARPNDPATEFDAAIAEASFLPSGMPSHRESSSTATRTCPVSSTTSTGGIGIRLHFSQRGVSHRARCFVLPGSVTVTAPRRRVP